MASNSWSVLSISSIRSTTGSSAEMAVSSGRASRNSSPKMSSLTSLPAGVGGLGLDPQQLLAVVPLVQRLGLVEALVALEPDQRAAGGARRAPWPARSCPRPRGPPPARACPGGRPGRRRARRARRPGSRPQPGRSRACVDGAELRAHRRKDTFAACAALLPSRQVGTSSTRGLGPDRDGDFQRLPDAILVPVVGLGVLVAGRRATCSCRARSCHRRRDDLRGAAVFMPAGAYGPAVSAAPARNPSRQLGQRGSQPSSLLEPGVRGAAQLGGHLGRESSARPGGRARPARAAAAWRRSACGEGGQPLAHRRRLVVDDVEDSRRRRPRPRPPWPSAASSTWMKDEDAAALAHDRVAPPAHVGRRGRRRRRRRCPARRTSRSGARALDAAGLEHRALHGRSARAPPSPKGSGASVKAASSSSLTAAPAGCVEEGDALADHPPRAGRPGRCHQGARALRAQPVGGLVGVGVLRGRGASAGR